MPGMIAESVFFWSGLLAGAIWAVLLWLQLPGQTPRPENLSWSAGMACLALSGGLAWALWSPVFGAIGAFFCLGGWSMALLCFMPVFWAFFCTYRSRQAPG